MKCQSLLFSPACNRWKVSHSDNSCCIVMTFAQTVPTVSNNIINMSSSLHVTYSRQIIYSSKGFEPTTFGSPCCRAGHCATRTALVAEWTDAVSIYVSCSWLEPYLLRAHGVMMAYIYMNDVFTIAMCWLGAVCMHVDLWPMGTLHI